MQTTDFTGLSALFAESEHRPNTVALQGQICPKTEPKGRVEFSGAVPRQYTHPGVLAGKKNLQNQGIAGRMWVRAEESGFSYERDIKWQFPVENLEADRNGIFHLGWIRVGHLSRHSPRV